MGQKRSTPEEIVGKLRQVAVLTGQGKSAAEATLAIYRARQPVGERLCRILQQ